MNIDIDKFNNKLCNTSFNPTASLIIDAVKKCEIKPVDCDECANFGGLCNQCINNKFTNNYFVKKEKQWYEKPESFPCLCWVGDSIPLKTDYIGLVVEFDDRFITSADITWRHAMPLTKSELLEYCLEEK